VEQPADRLVVTEHDEPPAAVFEPIGETAETFERRRVEELVPAHAKRRRSGRDTTHTRAIPTDTVALNLQSRPAR